MLLLSRSSLRTFAQGLLRPLTKVVYRSQSRLSPYRNAASYQQILATISAQLHTTTVSIQRSPGPSMTKIRSWNVKPCTSLNTRTIPEYVCSPHLKLHNVIWREKLQNIYLVKKPWNTRATLAMIEFIEYIDVGYPSLNVIVSEDVAEELTTSVRPHQQKLTVYTGTVADIVLKSDLIVTLGGDGTTLRAASAFLNGTVPPVLSFAMGSLGFLLPFEFSKFQDTFKSVFHSRSKALHRKRLECHVVRKEAVLERDAQLEDSQKKEMVLQDELAHYKQHHNTNMVFAMNDISLHRGSHPNLIQLDIFIDGEFLTKTTADGVVFATPTGSTAYSLSSGGSIVHPSVPCILLTPVCPRSLSFRPLVLPATSNIMVKLSEGNRNQVIKMNIDGVSQPDLRPGDEIQVTNEKGTIYVPSALKVPTLLEARQKFENYIEPGSNYVAREVTCELPKGIFCIAKTENDWTAGINELLGFNSSFGTSESLKNLRSFERE